VITYRSQRLKILAVDGWWHPGTVGAARSVNGSVFNQAAMVLG